MISKPLLYKITYYKNHNSYHKKMLESIIQDVKFTLKHLKTLIGFILFKFIVQCQLIFIKY